LRLAGLGPPFSLSGLELQRILRFTVDVNAIVLPFPPFFGKFFFVWGPIFTSLVFPRQRPPIQYGRLDSPFLPFSMFPLGLPIFFFFFLAAWLFTSHYSPASNISVGFFLTGRAGRIPPFFLSPFSGLRLPLPAPCAFVPQANMLLVAGLAPRFLEFVL